MKQREIKFRAWDGKKIHFNAIVGNGQVVFIPDAVGEYRWFNEAEIKPMQFTGLKDKNGKEIYEGDFLHRYLGVYWEVRFTKDRWQAHPKHECGLWLDFKQFSEADVVGNIYENPDLIK